MKATNILEKIINLELEAADFGFKWETSSQIIEQIKSEISEIDVHLKDGDRNKLQDEIIIGAVAYMSSGIVKNMFPIDWPVIRMLVVDPNYRNNGIGKHLTEECIRRAIRDQSSLIALHTSPIMEIALKMYLRMGFVLEKEAPLIYGVPYNIYVKKFA